MSSKYPNFSERHPNQESPYENETERGHKAEGKPFKEIHVDHPKGNLDGTRGDDGTISTSTWNAERVTEAKPEQGEFKNEEEANQVPAQKGSV